MSALHAGYPLPPLSARKGILRLLDGIDVEDRTEVADHILFRRRGRGAFLRQMIH
ncbi:uncharacterized protein METZ01_LOCUS439366, partial [marine metagenome]